jgi:diguanylate cyclase (GGDEF)-like protein
MQFNEHLTQAIARFRRDRMPFSVLFVDVDRFKSVNDVHGHAAGDHVLKEIADRFRSILRMEDTVARLGGDEFAILQVNGADKHDAAALAQRLLSAVSGTYRLDGGDVSVGISIGVASSAVVGDRIDAIVEYADRALYEAKRAGRNCYRLFSAEDFRCMARNPAL